jgi:hypothetical protein
MTWNFDKVDNGKSRMTHPGRLLRREEVCLLSRTCPDPTLENQPRSPRLILDRSIAS